MVWRCRTACGGSRKTSRRKIQWLHRGQIDQATCADVRGHAYAADVDGVHDVGMSAHRNLFSACGILSVELENATEIRICFGERRVIAVAGINF
jgi:hypothetical protein